MTENYEKIKKREKKDDGSYLLQAYWTAADAVEFDDGQTLDVKMETFMADTYDALDSFKYDINDKIDLTKADLQDEISDLDTKTSDEDTRLQEEIDDINDRIDNLDTDVQTDLSNLETTCKAYSDKLIEDLVGQAPAALDTIYELAEAMKQEQSVTDALNTAITIKVDKVDGKGLSTVDFTDTNYVHTDNNYDSTEKAEVAKVKDKVDKTSITTTISDTSTDTQVPGALTVYNALNDMNTNIKKQLESYSATEPTDGTNYWLELY